MILLAIFLLSFLLALLLVPATAKISAKLNAFKPKEQGIKGKPCLGGIGIYIALFSIVISAIFLKYRYEALYIHRILGMFLGSSLIIVLGIIDDINDINPFLKILGELMGIVILLLFGIFTKIVFLPVWANIIITTLWVIFITNAFNLLDIMDGLMSGLLIIIALSLFIIAFINRDIFSCILLSALIGAHLGFLKYNYPPAKVYMGDTGSLFSGFLLSVIAINISYAPLERPVALVTPILAMSLPIYDTFFLIIMRLKSKKPIFNKSKDHFALRLLTMGNNIQQGLWVMYSFSIFLAISAIIVAFCSNIVGFWIIGIVMLIFVFMGKRVGMVRVE